MRITLFLFLIISISAEAQYNETIRSARPGQAFGPFTTGKNIFQVQTGTAFLWFRDGFEKSDNFTYALSLRYGITERFEIRLASSWLKSEVEIPDNNFMAELKGIAGYIAGIRLNIKDGPKSTFSIQGDLTLDGGSDDFMLEDPVPRFILLHSQKLSETLGLTTNWAVVFGNNNTFGTYVINLSFPICPKFGSFIETYGSYSSDDFNIAFDTGLAYLINNDLQLDLTLGYDRNEGVNGYLIDVGVSWRTNNWKGE